MSDPRNLKVLEAAVLFAAAVHRQFDQLDPTRMPGMRSQILRAADSVPANIAEGARGTLGQRQNFYRIARGSADEVGAHLRVARRSDVMSTTSYWHCENKRIVVCKMLTNLIRSLDQEEAYAMHRTRTRLRDKS